MPNKPSLIVLLLLLFAGSAVAEVYTIDFNMGTINGMRITDGIKASTSPYSFCKEGAEFVTVNTAYTQNCFYRENGCGIRIGSENGTGILTLQLGEAAVYVSQLVIYASKASDNTTSTLTITCGSVFSTTIGNDKLPDYSPSAPASENYMLPAVVVDNTFRNLQLTVPSKGHIMLHRIDIILSDDVLFLPARSGENSYATFSSNKATFFPAGTTVGKVMVNDGILAVSSLDVEQGFGVSGRYIPANTGVLVSSPQEMITYFTLRNESDGTIPDNMLHSASEPMAGDNTFYRLAFDDNANETSLGFYWGAADGGAFTCEEGTAYLAVPGKSRVDAFILDVDSYEDAVQLHPISCDGMGFFHNLAGQRVSQPSQGVYIRDGKKYLAK